MQISHSLDRVTCWRKNHQYKLISFAWQTFAFNKI